LIYIHHNRETHGLFLFTDKRFIQMKIEHDSNFKQLETLVKNRLTKILQVVKSEQNSILIFAACTEGEYQEAIHYSSRN